MNLSKEQALVQVLINRPQHHTNMLLQDEQNAQWYLTKPDWFWRVVVDLLLKNGRDLNQIAISLMNTDELFDYKFVIDNYGKDKIKVQQFFFSKFKQHNIRFAEIKSLRLNDVYFFFTDYEHVLAYGNDEMQFNKNPDDLIQSLEADFKALGKAFLVNLLHEIKHPIFDTHLIMTPKLKHIYLKLEMNWYDNGLIPLLLLKSVAKQANLTNWEFTRLMHSFSQYYLNKLG